MALSHAKRASTLPHPLFLGLLTLLVVEVMGFLYCPEGGEQGVNILTLAFVLTTWVIGLCLHEYAHAVTAYGFGDYTIKDRGYLSLNPLTYFSTSMSFVLPLIILIMGGIAFPGAAVTIRTDLIKKPWQQSLVALAGPMGTLITGLVLIAAYFALEGQGVIYHNLKLALAVSAFFQVMALLFNLLPLPGLDGFSVILGILPPRLRTPLSSLQANGIVFIMLMVMIYFGGGFIFPLVSAIMQGLGITAADIEDGYRHFHFW